MATKKIEKDLQRMISLSFPDGMNRTILQKVAFVNHVTLAFVNKMEKDSGRTDLSQSQSIRFLYTSESDSRFALYNAGRQYYAIIVYNAMETEPEENHTSFVLEVFPKRYVRENLLHNVRNPNKDIFEYIKDIQNRRE